MSEHASLNLKQIVKDQELYDVASELLTKIKPIVENRRKLRESNEELVGLLREVSVKLDALVGLKAQNAEMEAKVLEKLNKLL